MGKADHGLLPFCVRRDWVSLILESAHNSGCGLTCHDPYDNDCHCVDHRCRASWRQMPSFVKIWDGEAAASRRPA
jgi:hypothetical protein